MLEVEPDRRGDGDGVDVIVREECLDGGVYRSDSELSCGRLGAFLHGIAQRPDLDPVGDVLLCEVRQDPAERDRTDPDDADAQLRGHGVPRSVTRKSTTVDDE